MKKLVVVLAVAFSGVLNAQTAINYILLVSTASDINFSNQFIFHS
jgi:hypothetical protein